MNLFCTAALFALVIMGWSHKAGGQSCLFPQLSHQYSFRTSLQSSIPDREPEDSLFIHISVIKATGKEVQKIRITSAFLFSKAFQNCTAARSFTTGYRAGSEVLDNDYGDL